MSNFWAKFYEPLPSAPLKPNNASAIFGGQAPYGLRAAEPSIFRPKDPTPNRPAKTRKKVSRSHSDVGISKSSEKRKSREIVVKRKISESSRNGENSSGKNNRPVSPKETVKESSLGDSPDSETNGDRYPLFISVKKPSEAKSRKSPNNENHCNGSPARRESECASPKTILKSSKVTKDSASPFDSLRREKTDFIIRSRKSTGSPTTALKREKSDITLRRSHSPSNKAKPRSSASPASIRRENSEITLKRSQLPTNLTREKSDLVRPRGSASPGPLRREKSDITSIRSRSPSTATTSVKPRGSVSPGRLRREKSDLSHSSSPSPPSLTKEKSDVIKPRGSTTPGSLKREKSDVSKKPPSSPSKSSLPKPRVSASVGVAASSKTKTPLKDSQPSCVTECDEKRQTCVSESEDPKERGEELNQTLPRQTVESTENNIPSSSDKREPIKKSSNSPSKSSIPKPRVSASTSLATPDKSENSSKDLREAKVGTDSYKSKESPKKESGDFVSTERAQDTQSDQFLNDSLKRENVDIHTNNLSSQIGEPSNFLSAEKEADQRNLSYSNECHLYRKVSPVSQSPNFCCDKSISNPEMSKIPTPTTSAQVSRIPSLTKASTPPSKIPPKSKIPSFAKKSEEESKTISITSALSSVSDKPASKIPGLQRADPAKENKDPALNGDKVEEGNKQNIKVSRIPSMPKTANPSVSKTPSMTRQENEGSQVTETTQSPKSRIPSLSGSQTNTSTPLSKIPSFTNKQSLSKTPSKEEPESKIPLLTTSTTTPKASGIPKPEVTATGIPKPENKPASTESRIPQLHSPPAKLTGIPKPEVVSKVETSTTPTEPIIPQFSTPKSKIPGPPGNALSRKDSDGEVRKPKSEETPKGDESLDVEKNWKVEENKKVEEPDTNGSPSTGKVPPTPPPRQDVDTDESKANLDLSMNEDIFTEAKRMEELLRNESIVVEVPTNEDGHSKEVGDKSEESKINDEKKPKGNLMFEESVEMKESANCEKEKRIEDKKKDPFSFKTFGKKEEQVMISPRSEISSTKLSLGLKKEEEKTDEANEKTGTKTPSPLENIEKPAIDTLGQYEQQSRRSRSRQRKIISPDGDEISKTFEQTDSEDAEIKTLDKESCSKVLDTESQIKTNKTKVKHDKPKFVIESSLGADFYQSKSSQSKDSIADEAKRKDVVVIQNKAFDDTKGIPRTDVPKVTEKTEVVANKNSAAFDDVELSSNRESKVEMKAWSMEELDEKTVKCSCGRGGKCSIM